MKLVGVSTKLIAEIAVPPDVYNFLIYRLEELGYNIFHHYPRVNNLTLISLSLIKEFPDYKFEWPSIIGSFHEVKFVKEREAI